MSDFSRDRLDTSDEDRLPWLEAVEDEDDEPGVGAGKLIAALIAGLIAIGLIVGGVFWLRERNSSAGGSGEGELIAAPEGNYKERPENPGGMQVEGTGDVAYGASEGADVASAIDLNAIPEVPVTEPQAPAAIETAPAPVPAPVAKVKPPVAVAPKIPAPRPAPKPVAAPVEAAPAPSAPGTIQLGAFSSEAKANGAWKSLSGRFTFLGALTSSVTPVKAGAGTLYRLRAGAGGDASAVCAKLRVAGESCAVVN